MKATDPSIEVQTNPVSDSFLFGAECGDEAVEAATETGWDFAPPRQVLAEYVSQEPERILYAAKPDSRHEERPQIAVPAVVCGIGLNGKIFFELTRTVDVSRSGCRIHLRTKPQMESPLAIRLIRPEEAMKEESIQILYRVAWLHKYADGWTIGAAVLDPSVV